MQKWPKLAAELPKSLSVVEDIWGCFSAHLILLPNYTKLGKMTLWRLLRSKWNLGTASNMFSSTFSHVLMSVEDNGGCFSVAPPLISLPNYSKLGKMTLWRLLRSKWNLGKASNILSSTFGYGLISVEANGGCFSVALPSLLHPNYSKMILWMFLGLKWMQCKAPRVFSSISCLVFI